MQTQCHIYLEGHEIHASQLRQLRFGEEVRLALSHSRNTTTPTGFFPSGGPRSLIKKKSNYPIQGYI